jgi:hypothetical protein
MSLQMSPMALIPAETARVARAAFSKGTLCLQIGSNEMDPPLCGSTAISHNEFTISEPIEPQEASPMKQEMHVLGIDIAKRVFR